MRLVSLEQAHFGALSLTRPLVFAPGLNILVAPNQAGKSTLFTLVEWALYGIPPKRTRRNTELFDAWAPWGGKRAEASLIIAPEREGWPAKLRLALVFDEFRPQLTDADLLEDITSDDYVTVRRNGTWDLGRRLTGLSRAAFTASLLAPQGAMESPLSDVELRKVLTADLAELVEDPERATLDTALQALQKPQFTMASVAEVPVQLGTLVRRITDTFHELRNKRSELERKYEDLAQTLAKREQAEYRQAAENAKLAKLEATLAGYDLAAADWRFREVDDLARTVAHWEPRLTEMPWLGEFPFELKEQVDGWQGEARQLGNQIESQALKLDQTRAKLLDLEDFLKRQDDRLAQLDAEDDLRSLASTLSAAEGDRRAADEEAREVGEVADPAARQRFDELKTAFEPHSDSLPEVGEWQQRHTSLVGQRVEQESRRRDLERLARIAAPPQLYAAAFLLFAALAVTYTGQRFVEPPWVGIVLGVVCLVGGALLAWWGVKRKAAADRAAHELRKVVSPAFEILLAAEAEEDRERYRLMERHGLDEAGWLTLVGGVLEYRELQFKLERYDVACRQREAASERVKGAWNKVLALLSDAPPAADSKWLERRIGALMELRQRQKVRTDTFALAKDQERELARMNGSLDELKARLGTLLEPLGLKARALLDPESAIRQFETQLRDAKAFRSQRELLSEAENKLRSITLEREEFERRWQSLMPERQRELRGLIHDEAAYSTLLKERRQLMDTQARLRKTLDAARVEADRLRLLAAKAEDVLLALPVARAAEEEAECYLKQARMWERALDLLGGALDEVSAELGSNLSPRITEELRLTLAQAPVQGIEEVLLSPHLGLRLRAVGAPPGLSDMDLLQRLSLGAKRQLALALRAAIARAVGDSGSVPLLLDEPLAELDDARALDCLTYLGNLGAQHQVIVATCHQAQYDWLLSQRPISCTTLAFP